MTETEGLLRQEHARVGDARHRGPSADTGPTSELAGKETLTQIFLASLVPFETATRMRKHFRIGKHSWTLIPAS